MLNKKRILMHTYSSSGETGYRGYAIEKLAEYEEIGFEPKEIENMYLKLKEYEDAGKAPSETKVIDMIEDFICVQLERRENNLPVDIKKYSTDYKERSARISGFRSALLSIQGIIKTQRGW